MLESLIKEGFQALSLTLPENALSGFRAYYDLLDVRSREFNLTAIRGEEDAARLHFLDCVGLLTAYPFSGKSVIDIGSGAGFPGLPLKISQPDIALTMVDATEKRVNFLSEACGVIGVEAACIHGRAEELAATGMRESYDVAVSRAVARLNVLLELCMPFIKVGGAFVSMKSSDSDEEIAQAKKAIELLGGGQVEIKEYPLPCTDIIRRAVIVKKTAPTPAKYPRRFAKIQKSPL